MRQPRPSASEVQRPTYAASSSPIISEIIGIRGLVRSSGRQTLPVRGRGARASKSARVDPDGRQGAGHADRVEERVDGVEQPLRALLFAVPAEAEH